MRQPAGLIVVGVATAFAVGCGSPGDSRQGAGGPLERTRDVVRAADDSGQEGVDRLISALDSDDAAERMLAITALERLTGETFGYDFAGPRAEREGAIDRWLEWRRAGHAEDTTRRSGDSGVAPREPGGMGDGA